jgi:hypothetical protein
MKRRLLSVLVVICVYLSSSLTNLPAEEPKIVLLKSGTPVVLEIIETVDSKSASVGSAIKLRVIRDVKVDDVVVIKTGTRAEGKVSEVKSASGWGAKGDIAMTLTNTYAVDDTEILLSATQRAAGESKGGTAAGVGIGAGLLCLPLAATGFFIKGEEGKLPSGCEVKGYVDGEYKIKVQVAKTSITPQVSPVQPTESTPPTSPLQKRTVSVTWTSVNVRSGPGDDTPIVTTVSQGDKLTVIGEYNDWFNVELQNGMKGWVKSGFVK